MDPLQKANVAVVVAGGAVADDDMISTLPTENGWFSDDTIRLYNYQGFWYYEFFLRRFMGSRSQNLSKLDLSPSDIIISSTPKSGTTWLKALSFAITTRTRYSNEDQPLHFKNPHDLVPFIEGANGNAYRDPDLPLVSTHLPYSLLPNSIHDSGCKIVYIWRDPKDAFISRWIFSQKIRPNKEVNEPIPLKEAFDLFCRGVSPLGPYWDHVLGYWKACLDSPNKILFLKYEDMMDDVEAQVKRLSEFMGCQFSAAEEEEGVVERIVEMCSFENLKSLEVNKSGVFRSMGSVSYTKDAFFRKAKVGDWKNHLTEEMAAKIDQITVDKLGASGLLI